MYPDILLKKLSMSHRSDKLSELRQDEPALLRTPQLAQKATSTLQTILWLLRNPKNLSSGQAFMWAEQMSNPSFMRALQYKWAIPRKKVQMTRMLLSLSIRSVKS
jgi:hypothetical protein